MSNHNIRLVLAVVGRKSLFTGHALMELLITMIDACGRVPLRYVPTLLSRLPTESDPYYLR